MLQCKFDRLSPIIATLLGLIYLSIGSASIEQDLGSVLSRNKIFCIDNQAGAGKLSEVVGVGEFKMNGLSGTVQGQYKDLRTGRQGNWGPLDWTLENGKRCVQQKSGKSCRTVELLDDGGFREKVDGTVYADYAPTRNLDLNSCIQRFSK